MTRASPARPQSAWAQVDSSGNEVTLWFYDQDVPSGSADKSTDIKAPEWNGLKVAITSDKPIVPGPQKLDGMWQLGKKAQDKDSGASFVGKDAKVTLDTVDLKDGAVITGKIDLPGDTSVRVPAFRAVVIREK